MADRPQLCGSQGKVQHRSRFRHQRKQKAEDQEKGKSANKIRRRESSNPVSHHGKYIITKFRILVCNLGFNVKKKQNLSFVAPKFQH